MRKSPGWVKIHSKILQENLTPSQFKFFVGSIVLANPPSSNGAGVVDLSVRQLSKALKMSPSEIWRRERELAAEGMITLQPNGFLINKYKYYQTSGSKSVSSAEHLTENLQSQTVSPTEHNSEAECFAHGTQEFAGGTVDPQSVSQAEQSVPLFVPEQGTKKEEDNTKKIKKVLGQGTGKTPDPFDEGRKKIFEELKKRRGVNSPNAGAEAQAITWMLKQGFTVDQIMMAHDKMAKEAFWEGKFLSMQSVKKQISAILKVKEKSASEKAKEWKEYLGGKDGPE